MDFTPLAFGPYVLPDWAQALGWLMALTAPIMVILVGVVQFIRTYFMVEYNGLNVFRVCVQQNEGT